MYQFNREEYNKRMEWYLDARFGMFLDMLDGDEIVVYPLGTVFNSSKRRVGAQC